jgi:pyroglutamyl-peptidase
LRSEKLQSKVMPQKILLTSFQTWLPHQKSNSSDDLLDLVNITRVQQRELDSLFFLRQLPVNAELATQHVIDAIRVINPQGIICCGMAESRNKLSVESNASWSQDYIFTKVKLDELVNCLHNTNISHDAGKFICEGLYYRLLKHIQTEKLCLPCIFVHIPVLLPENLNLIEADFKTIIEFIQSMSITA